jgi:hypothetical protein
LIDFDVRHERRLGGDIESNGLLRAKGDIAAMDRVHCIGYQDMDTAEEFYFGPPVPFDHPVWEMDTDDPWLERTRLLLANPTSTNLEDGVKFLAGASMSVFHNGANFDYRALQKFYPKVDLSGVKKWDTYVMAKLVWPADILIGPDLERAKKGKMPMNLLKSHSLKAWGYRLGNNKDDYKGDPLKFPVLLDENGEDVNAKERFARRWEEWNPYMARYMMQDDRPMVDLFKLIEKRVGWVDPKPGDLVWPEFTFEYEHEYATIIAEQEDFGVRLDMTNALKLERELKNQKAIHEAKLKDLFGSWWQAGEVTTPGADRNVKRNDLPDVVRRRISPRTGKELAPEVGPPLERYSVEAPFTPIVRTEYNPSSREHLGMRLQDVFGWHPKAYGKNGKPTVDEGTLEEIPEAVIPPEVRKLIKNYFVVNKTLGMVSVGRQAWLNQVDEFNRIHGRVDSIGAISRRCTHSSPNIAQCPAVLKKKVVHEDGTKEEVIQHMLDGRYGWECRELFSANLKGDLLADGTAIEEDWELTGVDASSLELIDLGHYLVPFDGGAFRDRVCDPSRDPHMEHSEITGQTRADTKTATYLYVFGGTAYKLSLAIDVEDDEIIDLLQYRGLSALLRALAKRFDDDFVAKMDDKQKAKLVKARKIILAFEEKIIGIKDLKEGISKVAERGWIKGMDGSKVHVRKAHAALNTVIQSAGAMSCKVWKVLMHRRMKALGYTHGIHYMQVLDVHDEVQWTHPQGMGPMIKALADECMKEAGRMLNLRGEYRTDGKTGHNWAETH